MNPGRKNRLALALVPFLFVLTACDTVGFYSQAVVGHLSLLSKREPIADIIDDPGQSTELVAQLELVQALTRFAESELGLPAAGQYTHYADLGREFVVWNVFAAPQLSLQATSWCYPIAGCTGYRGYFSEARAREFAEQLKAQGYDTYVGGVPAYSTLGWMSDPVLNTFVFRREAGLADLIFHELAHQQLYVPGDTVFNESFATTVAREGVRRWLRERGVSDQYDRYLEGFEQQEQFIGLVTHYRERLDQVYTSADTAAKKQAAKADLVSQLRLAYADLQDNWQGQLPYTAWIESPINNAKLNAIGFYYDLVPGFEHLLASEQDQLPEFYARCDALAELTVEQRREALSTP
jgi:predicted aminopeptidase